MSFVSSCADAMHETLTPGGMTVASAALYVSLFALLVIADAHLTFWAGITTGISPHAVHALLDVARLSGALAAGGYGIAYFGKGAKIAFGSKTDSEKEQSGAPAKKEPLPSQ